MFLCRCFSIVTWTFYSFSLLSQFHWFGLDCHHKISPGLVTPNHKKNRWFLKKSVFTFLDVLINGFVYDADILIMFTLFNFILWQCFFIDDSRLLLAILIHFHISHNFIDLLFVHFLVDSRNFMGFGLVFTLVAITRELPNHKV